DVACESGILRKIGSEGAVRFEHHRLQEYFASRRLASLFDAEEIDIYQYLDDVWWREVILMTAGIMNHPNRLIDEILDTAQAHRLEFAKFSEVNLEFARVMTAMNCYRSTSHRLTTNTRERLVEYLVQFLRHGNILQKVKALRVAPQFHDRRV